jgi:hypothetical protein
MLFWRKSKEKETLETEIAAEEEKIEIEPKVMAFEEKIDQYVGHFNKHLGMAVECIRSAAYPYDAKPYLENARIILKDIFGTLKEIKILEGKLVEMTKMEEKLLKKEKENS